MDDKLIRSIGKARAEVEIGCMNLTYNLMRYRQLTKPKVAVRPRSPDKRTKRPKRPISAEMRVRCCFCRPRASTMHSSIIRSWPGHDVCAISA